MKIRVVLKSRHYWSQDWYVLQEKWGPFWVNCNLGQKTNLFYTAEDAEKAATFRNTKRRENTDKIIKTFKA